jgi:hypothetical protein
MCLSAALCACCVCCQVANQAGLDSANTSALQALLHVVMQQSQQWLQEHAMQQQQPACHEVLESAVRWRNRCMRSVLAAAATTAAEGAGAAGTAACIGSGQLAVWLPEPCWQPLHALHTAGAGDTGAAAATVCSSASWRMLSPAWQLQQQPDDMLVGIQRNAASSSSSVQPLVVLCYRELQELLQHSRNVQKLQQLLLQLHVEQRLTPKLMECLLKGCLQLHKAAPDEQQQQQDLQQQRQVARHRGAADVLQERCLALYRLLHFLTAAAVKQRGLTGSCHISEAEVVEDAGLLRYSQW